MKHIHFLISLSIWLFIFLPMVFLSFFVVAILLKTRWTGTTTLFGNSKYSRMDACHHYAYPTYCEFFREWVWYCVRNPVSNLGEALSNHQPWAWEYTDYTFSFIPLTFNFGWKLGPDPRFKFRPRFK